MPLAEDLSRDAITALDERDVKRYNLRAGERFRLHPELGPKAFEGDIDGASLVLLLANPGFDHTSTIDDHMFARDGWGLSGLHDEAPGGLREWWRVRLRHLIDRWGAQVTSNQVACLQVTPWASSSFDRNLRLPSRAVVLDAAAECAARGAVMILMRAAAQWMEARGLAEYPHLHRVRSWRCSYVSPGNLEPHAWAEVQAI